MAYGLNNVPSQNAYAIQTEVTGMVVARVNLLVSNAPIYYQLRQSYEQGMGPDTGAWLSEIYVPCAALVTIWQSLSRQCSGFRYRSAVAGTPAQVTVSLIPLRELGGIQ